jgi:hypothetical protein
MTLKTIQNIDVMKFIQIFNQMIIYPLVICYIAIENGHRNSEFSHEKWWIFP